MTVEQKYQAIKKRLGLTDSDVAQMFGYKNAGSFANAKQGRERTVQGIVELYEAIVNYLKLEP